MKMKNLTAFLAIVTLAVLPAVAADDDDNAVLDSYTAVSTALSNDDLSTARKEASNLAENAKADGDSEISRHAAELAECESLDAAREQFKAMSDEATTLAKGSDKYHVMTCPMAKATWVQTGEKLMNPYMGKKMQQCGSMMKAEKEGSAEMMSCCTKAS